MFKDPKPNEEINIDGRSYKFANIHNHPDLIYAEAGKKAKVYKLTSSDRSYALKVFWPTYRNEMDIEERTKLIQSYKYLEGLQVANRMILTPRSNPLLIDIYPQFACSILMPWIEGRSWQSFLEKREPLLREQSLRLALSLANVLAELENNKLAHCDLSSGNIIFSSDLKNVELIDIEDFFSDQLTHPNPLPAGTIGYTHDWVLANGLWDIAADRIAGVVLLAEIMVWQFEDIRDISSGESYFSEGEFGHDSKRYRLMLSFLKDINLDLPELFRQMWFAKDITDCPSLKIWDFLVRSINSQGG